MQIDQGTLAKVAWHAVAQAGNLNGDTFPAFSEVHLDVKSKFAGAVWSAYNDGVKPDYEAFANAIYESGWKEGRYSNEERLCIFAGQSAFAKTLYAVACEIAVAMKYA